MFERIYNFFQSRRALALLIGAFTLLILAAFFQNPSLFRLPLTQKEKEEIAAKQREIVQNVSKEGDKKIDFLGLDNKGVFVNVSVAEDSLQKVNKDSYVFLAQGKGIRDLTKELNIKEVVYEYDREVRFYINTTAEIFIRGYVDYLNNALPLDKRNELSFQTVYTGRTEENVEGDEYISGENVPNPTHENFFYNLLLNGSLLIQTAGTGGMVLTKPIDGKGDVLVTMQKFFPEKITVQSKREFAAGSFKFRPSIPKDPTYSFDLDRKLSASDFTVRPGSLQKLYLYDSANGYLVPFLSQEALMRDLRTRRDIVYLLTQF
ncbi:hypothetical protein A2716_02865 [candidate division WWE3 bacterium RIFCSPHIGHO2_01_FULL_40_23]|uniref:DUF4340 domain-containing protein n=1 Tax=candidate division WWE3 bacterium RIFCSPLOWO2_01_FULL_41_18 TaxID=1802625 RepID=A0A1F4VFE8_UNCKA|nr:MAG: hypothetical protein A2716_02865 [candidate division WWE3 bacterium RIFCSPHIGHO2_01_FULL_40_23]OGC55927.1 MAG: hypothetical protein A3A78_02715 [candidate division WWE3 bacterium RIFCSPLOWO2_01_FULL_41_18]